MITLKKVPETVINKIGVNQNGLVFCFHLKFCYLLREFPCYVTYILDSVFFTPREVFSFKLHLKNSQ